MKYIKTGLFIFSLLLLFATTGFGTLTSEDVEKSNPGIEYSQSIPSELFIDWNQTNNSQITYSIQYNTKYIPNFRFVVSERDNQIITNTTGFKKQTDGTYVWDTSEQHPSITIQLNNSESVYYDEGSWGYILRDDVAPVISTSYTNNLETAIVEKESVRTRSNRVLIGEFKTSVATLDSETILIYKTTSRSELTINGKNISEQFENTVPYDYTPEKNETVTLFMMPPSQTDLNLSGEAIGNSAYIKDTKEYNNLNNIYLHEYLHTQREFNLGPRMLWFNEGSVEYMTASLMHTQSNSTTNTSFYAKFVTVDSDRQVGTLEDKDSWDNKWVPYTKGGKAVFVIDQQIREQTNNSKSIHTVYTELNEYETVTLSDFIRTVNAVSGHDNTELIKRLVTKETAIEPFNHPAIHKETYIED